MWTFPATETIVQDLRYGLRTMRRAPAFAIVAVASLGIGIGGAAAVYGLADALLLRKLPVKSPDELVMFRWFSGPVSVFESLRGNTNHLEQGFTSTSFSRVAFDALRQELSSKADVFGFADLYRINISVDGRPEVANGVAVSGNYFTVLGVDAAAGRLFVDEDDRSGAPPVAVISHGFWKGRFSGADPVGRAVVVNGLSFTILGVAPERFRGTMQVGQEHDVIVPLAFYDAVDRTDVSTSPNYWWVLMMARLRSGVAREHVRVDADLIVKRTTAAARPQLTARDLPRVSVEAGNRGQTESREAIREPLLAMALVIVCVLLVACANVANLLLARGQARIRELTIRVAIGAARGRVVRQLVTEGLLLAMCGGALALLIAKSIAAALLPALTGTAALLDDAALYWRVAGFTAAVAGGCTLLFALVPALRATNLRLASGLQESGRGGIGHRQGMLAGSLVVVQVALSMLIVTSAALLVYSLRSLERVDPGFDADGLLVFRLDPRQNGYDANRARTLFETAAERLGALAGVRAVSFASQALISGTSDVTVARPAGVRAPERGTADAQQFIAEHRAWRLVVGDEFLGVMGIRLQAGRSFTSSDNVTSQQVAVVNESLARQLFATRDVIGRQFVLGLGPTLGPTDVPIEIIGVSADARYTSVRRAAPPTVYVNHRQRPMLFGAIVVRTAVDPASIVPQVRATMGQLDPALPLSNLRTQREQIGLSLRRERLFAQLATLLGGVTMLLATIGLYGLLAYRVNRRTSEIGLRMALGAGRPVVRWMILKQSLVLVGVGLALGIPAALGGNHFVESLLFEVSPTNPLAIGAAAAAVTIVALIASLIPAHRAARVDPIVALRAE